MSTSGQQPPDPPFSSGFRDAIYDPSSPFIECAIFDKIKNQDKFGDLVVREFDADTSYVSLKLQYSADLLHDAYQSYKWDIERLNENMPDSTTPDHFKLSGYLAYWLRRNSPIVGWENIKREKPLSPEEEKFREFLFEYGRVYLPFLLGYRICWFFEDNRKDRDSKLPGFLDQNYVNIACYFMRYKNVSPHALGLVYRSLFFV